MLKLENHRHLIVAAFFLIILCIGFMSYDDYGISWDEPIQRNHGVVAASYICDHVLPRVKTLEIFRGIPSYPDYEGKHYGVIFHLPILLLERLSGLDPGTARLWETRHLYTFLWFYVGLLFFYRTLCRWTNWKTGLLGCFFMVLSPRLFAHSFYNMKDMAFLSAVMVVLYLAFLYLEKKNLKTAFWLAVALAVSINVRIMGLLFLALVVLFSAIDFAKHRGSSPWMAYFSLLALVIMTFLLTILFWPAAWETPFDMIWSTMKLKSHYTWDGHVLYLGEIVRAQDLPWHYSLVWIGVTTPILYLLLCLAGIIQAGKNIYGAGRSQLFTTARAKEVLFCVVSLLLPIGLVMVLKSTLYDGWRQLYFVYVPLLLLAINGWWSSCEYMRDRLRSRRVWSRRVNALYVVIMIVHAVYFSFWMVRNHPHQYGYFNVLAGSRIDDKFERDYWGLSARNGLEYIVNNDDRDGIRIRSSPVVMNNLLLIDPMERQRIKLVGEGPEDYIVELYRTTIGTGSDHNEVFSIAVDGVTLLSVFDLR